jgi:hypothetical protein
MSGVMNIQITCLFEEWRNAADAIRAELVRLCFEEKLLQGGIEPSNSLLFIDPWIALKSFHDSVKGKCQGLGELRFAAPGRTLDQNRLLELSRYVHLH